MADRQIAQSRKDQDGDITALCNPGPWWSPRLKGDAINDIESGQHTYFVQISSGRVDMCARKCCQELERATEYDYAS